MPTGRPAPARLHRFGLSLSLIRYDHQVETDGFLSAAQVELSRERPVPGREHLEMDVRRATRVDAGRQGRERIAARRPGLLCAPQGIDVSTRTIRVPPLNAGSGNRTAA